MQNKQCILLLLDGLKPLLVAQRWHDLMLLPVQANVCGSHSSKALVKFFSFRFWLRSWLLVRNVLQGDTEKSCWLVVDKSTQRPANQNKTPFSLADYFVSTQSYAVWTQIASPASFLSRFKISLSTQVLSLSANHCFAGRLVPVFVGAGVVSRQQHLMQKILQQKMDKKSDNQRRSNDDGKNLCA